jgi:hypothetical protein
LHLDESTDSSESRQNNILLVKRILLLVLVPDRHPLKWKTFRDQQLPPWFSRLPSFSQPLRWLIVLRSDQLYEEEQDW